MQELNKFDPLKAELKTLVDNIKSTVVSITDDKINYDLLKENKKILQQKRLSLVDDFKAERAGALAYQKMIIQAEKDIVGIIEPLENEITSRIKEVDEQEKIEKRKASLPVRKEMLAEFGELPEDDFILSFSDEQFADLIIMKKQEKLEADRLALQKEKDDLEAEKRKIANDKFIEEEKQKAVAKALQEKADADARAEKEKADKERQDALDQKQKELDEEKRIREEKEERENDERYQAWLDENGYIDNGSYYINVRHDGAIEMYKKISTFIK